VFFDDSLGDPETLGRIDPVLREISSWGAEVRRASSAAEPAMAQAAAESRPRAVIAGGPDGRLFRAVLEPICPVPFVAWPHPGLPGWAGPLDLVVVVSVDGHDYDEVSAIGEARRRGCALVVAAPENSPVHEAALGRNTIFLPAGSTDSTALAVPVLKAMHLLGLGPDVDAESVAATLDSVAENCSARVPADQNPAKELALALADDVPVVWGGSVLAARAARRVAEALRSASGRPAIAGDDNQIVPLLEAAPERDVFADPFEDGSMSVRPAVILLDDGADSARIRDARARLRDASEKAGVRFKEVHADDGPDIARFAALLATGRFAAAYLSLGLGRPAS
jgi:hypothetical protein